MLILHVLTCLVTTANTNECSDYSGRRGHRKLPLSESPTCGAPSPSPPPPLPPAGDDSFWKTDCSAFNNTKAHLSPSAEALMPDGFPYTVPVGDASQLPHSTASTLLTLLRITAGCGATAVARSYDQNAWDVLDSSYPVDVSCSSSSTCTIKVEADAAYAGFRVDAVVQDTPPTASAAASRLWIQGSFGPTKEG